MSDPLSIGASVVGIVTAAAHVARLLLDDIQDIKDAPDDIKAIKGDLNVVVGVLGSLEQLPADKWQMLGEKIIDLTKAAGKLCEESCTKFQGDLARWTRHSDGEKLAWQDQVKIGFFKKGQIKSMLALLQSCKGTLSLVLTMASLYVSWILFVAAYLI